MIDTGHRTDPLTEAVEAVARLAGVYRALPQSKLLGRLPDGRSRAQAGHQFAALLAALGQGVEERARAVPPAWRDVPFDGPFIVGDQIAVTGYDLITGARALSSVDELVWSADGRRVPARVSIEWALAAAGELQGKV